MKHMTIAANLLFFVLIVSTLMGCNEQPTADTGVPDIPDIRFIPNNVSYVAFPDSTFSTNLKLLLANQDINQDTVTSIQLLPETSIAEIQSFNVESGVPVDGLMSQSIHLSIKGREVGTHTFSEAVITTGDTSHTVPLGQFNVTVLEGESAGVLVLFKNAGIFDESIPNEFSVRNTTEETITVKEVVLPHSRVTFTPDDLLVHQIGGAVPIPATGFEIAPTEEVAFTLDWDVDLPADQPINIDVRPLLVVEKQGETQYGVMGNMIFRKESIED